MNNVPDEMSVSSKQINKVKEFPPPKKKNKTKKHNLLNCVVIHELTAL